MYCNKFISLLKLLHLDFSVQKHIKKINNTAGVFCSTESFNENVQKNIQLHDFGSAIMKKKPIN